MPTKEGSLLHHCRIREDFGLLGVDIWLKPCQSIGWLSGIDQCAERPTCLFVFQSTGPCNMHSASVSQDTPLAKHTMVILCFYMLAHLWYLPFHSLSSSRYCVFMSSFLYFFSELAVTFTAAFLYALARPKILKVYLFCNKSPLSSVTLSKGHLALLSIPSFRLLFQGIE